MPLDLLPDTFVCTPISDRLGQRLGPYHGFARTSAPDRPLFTFEEAERIAGNWKALPPARDGKRYDARYNPVDEAFCFYDAKSEAWHEWEGEDVGLAVLYPIGEGAWSWDCGS